ncbi:MAG TPA: glycosyltransferase family 4 protein [Xanthobacteraceae bacterium]
MKAFKLGPPGARSASALRVTMLGLRGFPDVQGGVETHAQNLALQLVELGCKVEVLTRSGYIPRGSSRSWRGIELVRLWSPRIKGLEAFVHSFLGVLRAACTRPDILHIHAIGPALFTPLARALGLRVVVTHHVLNYENEKWGALARAILRLGERAGMIFANGRIAVSRELARCMERIYHVPVTAIPNGIAMPQAVQSTAILQAFGLVPFRFVLMVARIDEQKRQLDLLEAFGRVEHHGWKLAFAGGVDYTGDYARAVHECARKIPGVVMLGHQGREELAQLYGHAAVFVLPSSHEGQPIAVLEALSYGCPAILSDIPAHRELALVGIELFPVGDIPDLADRLERCFRQPAIDRLSAAERERIMRGHDWGQIAQRTLNVYIDALRRGAGGLTHDSPRLSP